MKIILKEEKQIKNSSCMLSCHKSKTLILGVF